MTILDKRVVYIDEKFVYIAREFEKRLNWKRGNGDALLLEATLIREKQVQKPLNWRHDFIYHGMKIDAKEVNSNWFNIQRGKTKQYIESITTGNLTHFLFYTSDRDRDRLLVPGDVVTLEPIALCNAKKIIKNRVKESKHPDSEGFVAIETMLMLKEELNETNESVD